MLEQRVRFHWLVELALIAAGIGILTVAIIEVLQVLGLT